MGQHSQQLDKRYGAFRPTENIREMRLRVMLEIEQQKINE